jgi:hypothetical protein
MDPSGAPAPLPASPPDPDPASAAPLLEPPPDPEEAPELCPPEPPPEPLVEPLPPEDVPVVEPSSEDWPLLPAPLSSVEAPNRSPVGVALDEQLTAAASAIAPAKSSIRRTRLGISRSLMSGDANTSHQAMEAYEVKRLRQRLGCSEPHISAEILADTRQ